MGRLVQSIEIEELNHDVVHDCEEMSSMRKFNFIAIFYWKVLYVHKLVIQDVDDANFVRERDQQMQSWRMERKRKRLLLEYFYYL